MSSAVTAASSTVPHLELPTVCSAIEESYGSQGLAGLHQHSDATFAVRDGSRLLLGRGAFSGTSLFFREIEGELVYSTRLRDLARKAPAAPDPVGVRDYLCYGFVPAPRTVLNGVSSVPPGTILIYNKSNDTYHWESTDVCIPLPEEDPANKLWDLLLAAVKKESAQGLFLSGGLDSAAVALAACETGYSPAALHARFPAIPLDEDEDTHCARSIANRLSLQYEERRIGPLDVYRSFSQVIAALDQPFSDPVTLPFFLLSRLANGRFQNVLTGEGGDQFFGSWSMKPMLVHEAYGGAASQSQAYLESFHKCAAEYRELISPALLERLEEAPPPRSAIKGVLRESPVQDVRERIRWVDIRLKGLQHILPRIQAMGAANALSLAHPFFESQVLSLSFAVHPNQKLKHAREKVMLKDLLRSRLPDTVIDRRKSGMGVPTTAWFRRALRPLAWSWLRPRRVKQSGLLNHEAVTAVLKRDWRPTDARSRRWGDLLWMLCILEAWFADVREESQ